VSGWSLENIAGIDGYTMTLNISGLGVGRSKRCFASQKISRLTLEAHPFSIAVVNGGPFPEV